MSAPAPRARLVFRPFTVSDLDEVARLEADSYDFPWGRENFMDCLLLRHHCLLLEYQNVLCAYAVMAVMPGHGAHLLNICVRGNRRRMGFATRVLWSLFPIAYDTGARRMLLEVRVSNIAAHGLYRRLGFSRLGRKRDYYMSAAGREDAFIFVRPLSAEDHPPVDVP